MKRISILLSAIFPAILSCVVPALADPVLVTSCGSQISDAVLAGDLDCSAEKDFAVRITDGGRLDLAGHTLIGALDETILSYASWAGGVLCLGDCTIIGGGGSIVAPAARPYAPYRSVGVYITNGYVNDPLGDTIKISDVEITGWTQAAILGFRVVVSNSTLHGNRRGVIAESHLTAENCSIYDNEIGLWLISGRAHVNSSTITGNTIQGVNANGRTTFLKTRISNNFGTGYGGKKLVARKTIFETSCQDSGAEYCADIRTSRPPRFGKGSICGTSRHGTNPKSWGICTMD